MADERQASSKQYFASKAPDEMAADVLTKVEEFDQHLIATGRWGLWQRCYNYYNQGVYKDGRLNRSGEEGEYTDIYMNHFRNIMTHMMVMTTSQRPSFDARATNSDYKSQAQVIVANGILEFYDRYKGMDEVAKQAVEDCLVYADAYVYEGWDYSLGMPIIPDPKTGKMLKEGDVLFKNFTPMDVIFDYKGTLREAKPQWYCIRDFQNKWDLAMRFPEKRDKILMYSDDQAYTKYAGARSFRTDSDYVPVFIFMHDRTDAMPEGRFVTFLSRDCVFIDSALPEFYKTLPVKRLRASEQRSTGFGYSVGFDLAPIQEAINGLHSTIVTNQSTFGVQNIVMAKGSNIGVTELADGMNVIIYDPKYPPPAALALVSTPKEIFDYIEMLESSIQTISGVNSVQRGNPEASLKSGNALALVQSMAVQFMSGLQQSYAKLLEDLGTGLINVLQAQATTPRLIEIAGKNNRSYVKEFTAKDISEISRVTVDLGNPVSRTLAGKVNVAENLLNAKLIDTPEQYLQVLATGKLEPLIEGKQAELMLIRSENEAMSEGRPVQATIIDSHHLHVMEHRCVIASPEARKDPGVVQAVIAHIQQHIDLWKTTDPSIMAMIGEPPPPPPPTALPEPAPEAAPAPGNGGGKAPSNAAAVVAGNPTIEKAQKIKLPQPAKNPLPEAASLNGGMQ